MTDFIGELLHHEKVKLGQPAPETAIAALKKHIGTDLPEALLRIWRAGENVRIDALDADIPCPADALWMMKDAPCGPVFLKRGFVPILNDHQSNYVAVLIHPPLAFRVAYLPHDDATRLLYRDMHGFAKGSLAALEAGTTADLFFRKAQGDYGSEGRRTKDDQDAARLLMATDGKHEEWKYAVQLLDESNLDEWSRLLETDHFVRRDVLARLREMQSLQVRQLLQRDRRAFAAFAKAVGDAARSAGLNVGEQNGSVLHVARCWIELERFFYRRNIRDAMPRLVAWLEDAVAGRNPHDRPDNFMAD